MCQALPQALSPQQALRRRCDRAGPGDGHWGSDTALYPPTHRLSPPPGAHTAQPPFALNSAFLFLQAGQCRPSRVTSWAPLFSPVGRRWERCALQRCRGLWAVSRPGGHSGSLRGQAAVLRHPCLWVAICKHLLSTDSKPCCQPALPVSAGPHPGSPPPPGLPEPLPPTTTSPLRDFATDFQVFLPLGPPVSPLSTHGSLKTEVPPRPSPLKTPRRLPASSDVPPSPCPPASPLQPHVSPPPCLPQPSVLTATLLGRLFSALSGQQ